MSLGFSDHEARAYVELVKKNPITGYELAKAAKIPAANAYAALNRLEERQAVMRIDGPNSTKFAPVPPEELMDRLSAEHADILTDARKELQSLSEPADLEYVWNTRGYKALIDQARTLGRAAKNSLMVAVCPPEAGFVANDMRSAVERGVQVTTLCLANCEKECGVCVGDIHRVAMMPDKSVRWFAAIADHGEILAGEVTSRDEATTVVRTRHRLIVEIAKSYIQQAIMLAAIEKKLGQKFYNLIGPHARSIVDTFKRERGAGRLPQGATRTSKPSM
jgi:sugar-specific transcriptional regulator TrmB